jgi:hypothetical protein
MRSAPYTGSSGLAWRSTLPPPGAGRLLWPLLANLTRLVIATGIGWLALWWSEDLSLVFVALAVALAAFGLINAAAMASGAWFAGSGSPVGT